MLAEKHKIEKEQNNQLRDQISQLLKVEQEQKLKMQERDLTIQSLQVQFYQSVYFLTSIFIESCLGALTFFLYCLFFQSLMYKCFRFLLLFVFMIANMHCDIYMTCPYLHCTQSIIYGNMRAKIMLVLWFICGLLNLSVA